MDASTLGTNAAITTTTRPAMASGTQRTLNAGAAMGTLGCAALREATARPAASRREMLLDCARCPTFARTDVASRLRRAARDRDQARPVARRTATAFLTLA